MADLKISALEAIASLQDADLFVVVDDSEISAIKNKKLTWSVLKAAISSELGSNFALSDLSNTNLGDEAAGDILYYSGSAWDNFPKGTPGFFLQSTGSGLQWADVPESGIPDAPFDTAVYGRSDGAWADIGASFLPLTLTGNTTVNVGTRLMKFSAPSGGYYVLESSQLGGATTSYYQDNSTFILSADLTTNYARVICDIQGGTAFPYIALEARSTINTKSSSLWIDDNAIMKIGRIPLNHPFGGLLFNEDYATTMTTDRHIPDIGKVKSLIGDELTFSNGITNTSGAVKLGGDVDEYTVVNLNDDGEIVFLALSTNGNAGFNVGMYDNEPFIFFGQDTLGYFVIDKNNSQSFGIAGVCWRDLRTGAANRKGIEYYDDYSAGLGELSLMHKKAVRDLIVEYLYDYNLI